MTEDLAPTAGPDDATPGAPDEEAVDVVVIGAGPVGENAAQYAHAAGGLEVALVEADLLGGECSYWACMPSKALLRPLEDAGLRVVRGHGRLAGPAGWRSSVTTAPPPASSGPGPRWWSPRAARPRCRGSCGA